MTDEAYCEMCESMKPGDDVENVKVSAASWHEPAHFEPVCADCRAEAEREAGEQARAEDL